MGRALRRVGMGIVALLVAAQLVPVARTNPPVERDVDAPPDVHAILRRACYDCHSRETVWPWYSHVAPASWLVVHDVREGRAELDFSTWGAYPPAKKVKKLKETADEVAEGDMPPWDYALVHRAARLDPADRDAIRVWTTAETARLAR